MSFIIVDFGSQYTHLITKMLNYKLGVSSVLIPYTYVDETQLLDNVKGVILSGGPKNVNDIKDVEASKLNLWFQKVLYANIPVLGICFGHQWLAKYFGGSVEKATNGEFGNTEINTNFGKLRMDESDSLATNENPGQVWMSHQDQIVKVPDNFVVVGSTTNCPNAIIVNHKLNVFGVQYHPEVDNTDSKNGIELFEYFVYNVCCAVKSDLPIIPFIIEQTKQETLRQLSSNDNGSNDDGSNDDGSNDGSNDSLVLLALSGGVDSTVLCKLLYTVIPERVYCVFVNNGLMRKGEVKEICDRFAFLGNRFVCYNAKRQFLNALHGVSEPEQKRKIIGGLFIDVFDEITNNETQKLQRKVNGINGEIEWLAQGTIYPDIIESSGLNGTAQVIKSHHNVGGLPERLQLRLLEPFKYLFKDQVRKIGEGLGLDQETINRHPFPGPGLGIRVLGEVKPELLKIVKQADKIYIDALKREGFYYKTSQAYAAILPIKTVGVVGDNRRYQWTIMLRAVTSNDFMTATATDLGMPFLTSVATEIINKCPGVSRVLFDVTSKPPGTVECE